MKRMTPVTPISQNTERYPHYYPQAAQAIQRTRQAPRRWDDREILIAFLAGGVLFAIVTVALALVILATL